MESICICILMAILVGNQAQAVDFNVKKYGAKADGKSDDSTAIANAWKEACKSTQASNIVIPAGTYMVGPIKIQGPCQAPITIQANQARFMAPANPSKFKSQSGWFTFQSINGFTLLGGTFDGQGEIAWKQNDCAKTGKCSSLPINVVFNKISNSLIRDMASLDSKLFHMNVLNCKNLTLQRIKISAPEESLNTDGIHIGRSNGINITNADIKTGDDCVSLGDGSQQVNIEKVTCGPGHGIAIGSLGRYNNEEPVIGITVKNCTITNTMNGVRVKTWPASPSASIARGLHFQNIVMNNVSTPILIDQEYCPYNQCQAEISDVSFDNIRGTTATQLAVKLKCSKGYPCKNVRISNINLAYHGSNGKATSECANVKPKLTGHLFPPACQVSSA
ncbi:Polygalacturonase [Handroanthus impetiginosus]|uniref:Polygalacturonase n=1 Tax=Handroanthus impetiginosus TaxID=429701 RepID=A0A2G9HJB3_9LAMI|nr:Polygalacturonase [Handroanthus impetiginosus]